MLVIVVPLIAGSVNAVSVELAVTFQALVASSLSAAVAIFPESVVWFTRLALMVPVPVPVPAVIRLPLNVSRFALRVTFPAPVFPDPVPALS